MPLFSIIIPTYNSGKVIGKSLDSCLSQTFSDFEIIIQDGKSTDNTLEIVEMVKERNPLGNIHLYVEADSGVYDAMNKAIEKAAGDWIYFLGSDDYLIDEEVLQEIGQFILSGNDTFDVIYGDVISEFHKRRYDGPFDYSKLLQMNICHQSIFYKKSVFTALGLFNLKYPMLADYDFNLRVFLNPNFKSHYVNRVIAFFAKGGLSASFKNDSFYQDLERLVKLYGYQSLPIRQLKRYCSSNLEFLQLFLKRIFA